MYTNYVHIYMYTFTCLHIDLYTYRYTHIYVYTYIHTYTHIFIHLYIYIYIHILIHLAIEKKYIYIQWPCMPPKSMQIAEVTIIYSASRFSMKKFCETDV